MLAAGLLTAPPLLAQRAAAPRAYLLNVGIWSDSSAAGNAAAFDLQRVRLMSQPRHDAWQLDLAWETFLTLSTRRGGGIGTTLGAPSSGEWLPLQGTLTSGAHGTWRHRVDRMALRYTAHGAEITVGRQAISWATTLLLTPADPFAPFDPSDPFREYRAGVDAARVLLTPGPFSEVDVVARVADTPAGHKVTAVARMRGTVHGVELSGWGGTVYGEPATALGVTLTAAGAALRGEIEVRRRGAMSLTRAAVGADRSWEVAGRTLYLGIEYQHDDFGALRAVNLPAVFLSVPAARGELQVFGRDEAAVQTTFQVDPLVGLELLSLLNLHDHSALIAPALSWSATSALTIRAGAFVGAGRGGTSPAPASEYGPLPMTLYASASMFF